MKKYAFVSFRHVESVSTPREKQPRAEHNLTPCFVWKFLVYEVSKCNTRRGHVTRFRLQKIQLWAFCRLHNFKNSGDVFVVLDILWTKKKQQQRQQNESMQKASFHCQERTEQPFQSSSAGGHVTNPIALNLALTSRCSRTPRGHAVDRWISLGLHMVIYGDIVGIYWAGHDWAQSLLFTTYSHIPTQGLSLGLHIVWPFSDEAGHPLIIDLTCDDILRHLLVNMQKSQHGFNASDQAEIMEDRHAGSAQPFSSFIHYRFLLQCTISRHSSIFHPSWQLPSQQILAFIFQNCVQECVGIPQHVKDRNVRFMTLSQLQLRVVIFVIFRSKEPASFFRSNTRAAT